ncbi:MAG: hypothetical protein HQ557_11995 [Bacteroidetes bacterium]|nr:hypothetical protein [Bacteroidota bacterium]
MTVLAIGNGMMLTLVLANLRYQVSIPGILKNPTVCCFHSYILIILER